MKMIKFTFSLLFMLVLIGGLFSSNVLAYNLTGEHWRAGTLTFGISYISASNESSNALNNGTVEWNNTNILLTLSEEPIGSNVDFTLGDYYDPNTDNDGISYWQANGGITYNAQGYLNAYYTDDYGAQKRLSVAAHEVGHILGLSHSSGAVLMNGSTGVRYGIYGIYYPTADDVNGVQSYY